ncbi:MAG: endonuclease/exonuclease/phosphatase family protein [Sedimentisphaerales bacterium]|nr:endonuclease/exonuclease/phosphatase family protein [Sedimentisphaerales bacterium]
MSPLSLIRATVGVLLFMLGLVCGADAPASRESQADKPDLLVMTFNIRYGTADDKENSWDNRKGLVFDVLRRNDPDVVGLQEALRSQLDDIRAALPRYGEIGVGRDDGKTAGEYSAILYKKERFTVTESGTFWLSDTPQACGSITWGNNCTRVCTWGRFVPKQAGRSFYLFNTHLDHVSQYSRERSAILLTTRIHDRAQKDPFVVTGDFNTGEDNPVVRYLKGEQELHIVGAGQSKNPIPLIDTFRVLHAGASEVGTFHTFKGVRTNAKIDYIFAEPGTKVLQAEILYDNKDNRYPSDHFPVKAAIRFPIKTAN